MRHLWKERIQHAINQTIYHGETEYGALIVGGRRINRKKRKNKPVKKDQNNNNKKTSKKDKNKNKKYFNNSQDAEAKNPEKSPLVKHDSLEAVSPEEEQEVVNHLSTTEPEVEVATETESTSKMPFSFFKKKEPVEEKKPLEDINTEKKEEAAVIEPSNHDNNTGSEHTGNKESEHGNNSTKASEQEAAKEAEAEDGGTDKPVNGEVKTADEKIDGQATTPPPNDVKKEDSPLITKESKVKDTGPGMLCCTIM